MVERGLRFGFKSELELSLFGSQGAAGEDGLEQGVHEERRRPVRVRFWPAELVIGGKQRLVCVGDGGLEVAELKKRFGFGPSMEESFVSGEHELCTILTLVTMVLRGTGGRRGRGTRALRRRIERRAGDIGECILLGSV
jgi:hypothetical protein